jgi:hypothetical protein
LFGQVGRRPTLSPGALRSAFANHGTTPTNKFLKLNPSRLLKQLRMGSVQMPHAILITRTESWGFIKSSARNQIVHMKLSLCLNFYLRSSLGGYTVGTTAGFLVKIMKALAHNLAIESRGRARSNI